ncbi:hypothetical protein Tco_0307804 [Tanacetum coccineum]
MNKNFIEMMRQIQSVKSIDTKCETCGGPHSFTKCPAADGYTQEAAYATTGNYNSGGNSYQPQVLPLLNSRGGVNSCITTDVELLLYDGPTFHILFSSSEGSENVETEVTRTRLNACLARSMALRFRLMPLSIWKQLSLSELTSTLMTLELADRSTVHLKGVAKDVLVKVGKINIRCLDDEAITLKVGNFKILLNSSTSGNPTPSDPIIASSSPLFTPFEGGDFILEEIESFCTYPEELSNLD